MTKSRILRLIISSALALSIIVGTGCELLPSIERPPSTGPPSENRTGIEPNWQIPSSTNGSIPLPDIASVVARVKPAVVAITTETTTFGFGRSFTQEGAGSGWIIDPSGIIVTNNHVIEGARTITVTLDDGRTVQADMNTLRADPLTDLAVMKIDAGTLPSLPIGDSRQIRVGNWVVAIGNALGLGIRATQGIISAKDVSLDADGGQTLGNLIETTAAINPGNSGGPLVNLAGEVIGITSLKIATSGVEGMGYAISAEEAGPIIQGLIRTGYVVRPWLGVSLYTVDQLAILRYRLSTDTGVLITEIVSGSPADRGGLKVGDVITGFGGRQITTGDELIRAIHAAPIGQAVEVQYWRGSNQARTSVTLVESPAPSP